MIEVRDDDLSGEETRRLLALHLEGMRATSPADGMFALDLAGLMAPEVTVWSAWVDGAIAGIGALKMLSADEAEIKSMRTHPDYLRRGVAAALLSHIVAAARARGVKRLSLETGRGSAFEPALALYHRRGFKDGGAFGSYAENAFSQFLHRVL